MDDFEQLKREYAQAQREQDQLKGQRKQLLAQLKEEFGVTSLEEAESLLDQRSESERAVARKFTARVSKFRKLFARRLPRGGEE